MSFRSLLTIASFLSCLAASTSVFAQDSTASLPSAPAAAPVALEPAAPASTAAQTSAMPLPSIKAPKFGGFAVKGGVKVATASGRLVELDQKNGRRVYGKTEYFAGINHDSGFGLQARAVTQGTTYGSTAAEQNVYGAGNPSVSLSHPIFKNDDVKATGLFRKYFNVTDRAKAADYNHIAYYQTTNVTMARGWGVENILNPRTFLKGEYKTKDTLLNVLNTTTVTKTIYPWMKLGAGAEFGFERHYVTENGTSLQVFPTAIFTPSENIFLQAAIYMPVHKVNEVDDTPVNVALDGSQAQFAMVISM